jgi:hypothetical protein
MSSYEDYNYSEEEEDPYIGNYPDDLLDFPEEEEEEDRQEEEEDRHEEEELSEYT